MSLEDIVKTLASSSLKFQQDLHQLNQETKSFQLEARTGLTNIDNWITQLVTTVSKLENKVKLPTQIEYANVSAITLKSDYSYLPPLKSQLWIRILLDPKIQVEVKDDEKNETQDVDQKGKSFAFNSSLYS